MSQEKEYTIIAFSENRIGLLNRITIIFTRRHINIESLTVGESAVKGVYKFTIVINTAPDQIEKVTKQIEKLVDVIKAFYFEEKDIVYQEIALYKVSTDALTLSRKLEAIIRDHNARILEITPDYTVIEKTGHKEETQALFDELDEFNVLQFTRSGRVAITKLKTELLSKYLKEVDKLNNHQLN
ncbi:MAG: acetolactate synthase small subunit [Bacteroidota bacterium]